MILFGVIRHLHYWTLYYSIIVIIMLLRYLSIYIGYYLSTLGTIIICYHRITECRIIPIPLVIMITCYLLSLSTPPYVSNFFFGDEILYLG